MRILIVTNLYPWPGQPTRGMYNAQTVRELSRQHSVAVRVLVPEWRVWRWGMIRRWQSPVQGVDTAYLPVFYLPGIGRSLSHLTYRWSLQGATQDEGGILRAADGDTPSLPKAHTSRGARRTGATLSDTIKGFEAVLAPWLYPDGAAVAEMACRQGKPVWLMALGSDTFHLQGRARSVLKMACSRARGIVCVCRLLADRLADAGVPRQKLHVVSNGVDTALFRYRNKAELLGCQAAKLLRGQENGRNGPNNLTTEQLSNSQLILFVGNLVPVKGPDVMLRAFAALDEKLSSCQVAELLSERPEGSLPSTTQQPSNLATGGASPATQQPSNPTTLLLIIGSGPMRPQLERLAKDLNISNRVHYLGNRPHAEVALWMNVADVLCLPSRSEGMPNVVLEARASGLPVVTTPAGACPELPLDRRNLIVTTSFEASELATGLREILGRGTPSREADPAVPTWRQEADGIVDLIQKN